MRTRRIGNLEVSEIGMGCMGFSHGYGKVPEESYSLDAIRQAQAYGCTFFDTAESYGDVMFYPGHNEALVGKAVQPFRKGIVLATKFHIHAEEPGARPLYDTVLTHLASSMERLHTDYIDLYYLHRTNDAVPVEDIASVMDKLIQSGAIRAWGLSQVSVQTLKKAHESVPVAAVQNLYSMVERDCEKDIFPYCTQNGIGVVPFSPTSSGFLSGKVTAKTQFEGDDVRKWVPQLSADNLSANQPILDILARFAAEKHATEAQISLAWMLHKYQNVVPIPGSRNQTHILENLASGDVSFTEDEFTALESALAACTVHGHRGHVESEQSSFGNNWNKE